VKSALDAEILDRLSNEIRTSLSKDGKEDSKKKDRFAERCGLTSLSSRGSFAALVGVHEDLPEVVIKVVPNYDMFLPFAEGVLDGRYKHKWFPKVYSVTRLETHSIVTLELLPDPCSDYDKGGYFDRLVRTGSKYCDRKIERDFVRIVEEFCLDNPRAQTDFHSDNIRQRSKGGKVIIDPFWSTTRTAE